MLDVSYGKGYTVFPCRIEGIRCNFCFDEDEEFFLLKLSLSEVEEHHALNYHPDKYEKPKPFLAEDSE